MVICEQPILYPLVIIDQGCMATPPPLDMVIEAIIGQVGVATDEPAKGRKLPFEDAIPGTEPMQRSGSARPKGIGLLLRLPAPAVDDGVDELASTHGSPLLLVSARVRIPFPHLCPRPQGGRR